VIGISELTVFLADDEQMKYMVKSMHEWLIQLLIEAEDSIELKGFRTALDKYYTAYTVLRDCILPWLNSYVSCELRSEEEKEKQYVKKA